MPKGKRLSKETYYSEYETKGMTGKGPAYYPGEVSHGTYGDTKDSTMMAGQGSSNLSPPGSEGMGAAMTGAGLPPASGINLSMAPPASPLPPGPEVNPGLPIKCELPPGPNADPGLAAPSPLPPGPGDLEQGDPETGITPAGPPL